MKVENPYARSALFHDGDLDPFAPARNMPASLERVLTYSSSPNPDLATLAKLQRTAVKEISRAVDRESYKTRSKTENVLYSSDHTKTKLENYRQHLHQLTIAGLDRTTPPTDGLRETKSIALLTVASGTRLVAGVAAMAVAVVHSAKNKWITTDKSIDKVWKCGSVARKTFRAIDLSSAAQEHVLRKNSSTEEIAIEASKTINTTLEYIADSGARVADQRLRERQLVSGDGVSGDDGHYGSV